MDKCIICGGDIRTRCKCLRADTICVNGHEYHHAPNGEIHQGRSDHASMICCHNPVVLGNWKEVKEEKSLEAALKVSLISNTPNPEKVIATAAKLCYSSSDIESLMSNLTEEKIESFINMLSSLGHESPFEHVSFTFAIEGVSRSLTHQLVRHRIASYSQQSQRYVKEGSFEYVVPPEIARNKKAKARFLKAMEDDQQAYDEIADALLEQYCEEYLIIRGWAVDMKKKASENVKMLEKEKYKEFEKKAIEDARYVLPNATETKIIMTMNVRSLFNLFHHRCCNRAQWEIRALAEAIVKIVRQIAPNVFKYAGPKCINSKCPEGSMSCGKMRDMKERYLGV